jgi:nucleoside-diphosphate-sugar epimerase
MLTEHLTPLGYIGGSVLQRLLDHPERDTFEITALVRSIDKAKLLNTLGINTVVASLADLDKLTEFAAASDVVIHTVIILPSSLVSPSVLNPLDRQMQMTKRLPEHFFVGRKRATTRLARFLVTSTLCVEYACSFSHGC